MQIGTTKKQGTLTINQTRSGRGWLNSFMAKVKSQNGYHLETSQNS